MTLRARLVIAVTAVLLVVLAGFGAVALTNTRRVMLAQIDQRLEEVLRQPTRLRPNNPGPREGGDRIFAEIVLNGRDQVVASSPSGLVGDLDPLPRLDDLPRPPEREYQLVTVPSEDGSFTFRAGVLSGTEGFRLVVAQPLRDVVAATTVLRRRLLTTGLAVLVVGGSAVWLTMRRGLKPVDDMIATATAIADGNLGARVPTADPGSELGQLSSALNHMLTNIEGAFDAETRAKDRLKQFVADASHELRTPIAAISGYTELHRKGALEEVGGTNHAMARIEAESRRMRHLVEDLLLLARLDLDQPLDRRHLDLAQVAADACADSRAIDPERPVILHAPPTFMVSGDPERLIQVMANLLQNARTHTPPGTAIEVSLSGIGDWAEIVVRDFGPGFPPDSLGSVFDRFYRADDSRSRKSGGSGLGLAIVDAIARSHRGTATAANRPDGGAELTVRIPLG